MLNGNEILIGEELDRVLADVSPQKPLHLMFIAPGKGRFHLGFIAPLLKIKEISDAGGVPVIATILVSPLEAFLDNEKVAWAAIQSRAVYFREMFISLIKHLKLDGLVKVEIAGEHDKYLDRYGGYTLKKAIWKN